MRLLIIPTPSATDLRPQPDAPFDENLSAAYITGASDLPAPLLEIITKVAPTWSAAVFARAE